MTLASGSKLGFYEIVSLVGVGGMERSTKAKDFKLGCSVAVKVLHKELEEPINIPE